MTGSASNGAWIHASPTLSMAPLIRTKKAGDGRAAAVPAKALTLASRSEAAANLTAAAAAVLSRFSRTNCLAGGSGPSKTTKRPCPLTASAIRRPMHNSRRRLSSRNGW